MLHEKSAPSPQFVLYFYWWMCTSPEPTKCVTQGKHCCLVVRSSMECKVYPTLLHVTGGGNWTSDVLILCPVHLAICPLTVEIEPRTFWSWPISRTNTSDCWFDVPAPSSFSHSQTEWYYGFGPGSSVVPDQSQTVYQVAASGVLATIECKKNTLYILMALTHEVLG